MTKDHSSKARSRELAERSRQLGRPARNPCRRCSKRNLPCVVSRVSGRCSECCQTRLSCSLMPTAQEFDKAAAEHRRLQLALAQLKADSAAAELRLLKELAAAEEKERSFFRQEEESILQMEELEKAAENESSEGSSSSQGKSTDAHAGPVVPSLSEPFAADLDWLQTDELLPPSSFDLDAFVQDFPFQSSGSSGDRLSPIPCSS